MPELPEVETVKRGLARKIVGKTVADVEIRHPKSFADDAGLIRQVLIEARVVAIARRAKILLIELSTNWTLAVHLKMTGQLVVIQNSAKPDGFVGGHSEKVYEGELPNKHTQVIFTFSDKTKLYFNDLRKFGWLRLFPREIVDQTDQRLTRFLRTSSEVNGHLLGGGCCETRQSLDNQTLESFLESLQLGPEPLSADFTEDYLSKLSQKRSIPIKQLLLEQKGISGIGNIYADEALFRSKIAPRRRANGLKRKEIEELYSAIREVLELGIKHGGTSKNTYRNVEGTKGKMQDHLKVYQRTGKPCIVCATPIERIKTGGRSAHFCPTCQK